MKRREYSGEENARGFSPRAFFARHADAPPLLFLTALALLYWHRVLFFDQVLLPGDFLRGFAPFGSDPQAPWNILQWDALGQYYPWRFFAAQQLHAGLIPLWNPHQFSGTPFVANDQSAVFYPLGFPFWLFDTARAFGISAFLHTLLAGFGAYFLARHWNLSRAAALLSAIAFAFCGYLAAWIVLPTLANTASWLPLLLLLFERACEYSRSEVAPRAAEIARVNATSPDEIARRDNALSRDATSLHSTASTRAATSRRDFAWFSLALASCFLAGHPQIFFYVCAALFLRALTISPLLRAARVLALGALCAICLGALQLLPFLELARIGHRAGTQASAAGWHEISIRALQPNALFSLFLPDWPALSFDENKGYAGLSVVLMAFCGLMLCVRRALQRRKNGVALQSTDATPVAKTARVELASGKKSRASTREAKAETQRASDANKNQGASTRKSLAATARQTAVNEMQNVPVASTRDTEGARQRTSDTSETSHASTRALIFCTLLLLCGLLYAMATPLPQLFYFVIPGFSQTGGVGRALILWNLGAALLAAFALDALKNHAKFSLFSLLAILIVGAELFATTSNLHPTSSRQSIYPRTQTTDFLRRETRDGARVLLLTPRETWLPSEGFRAPRTHPRGVLMTNGATVYGLNDVSGYDSLALKSYRAFVAQGEENGAVSPPLNGNILLLNNPLSKQLDALNVRFIVSENELAPQVGEVVLRAEGCIIYRRRVLATAQNAQTQNATARKSGADFAPGWKDGVYQPQSFRLGAFVSLCALFLVTALLFSSRCAPLRVLARRPNGSGV